MRFSRISMGFFRPLLVIVAIATAQILNGCGEESAGPAGDPDAQLVLLAPKGGEKYHVGEDLAVRWKAQGKGVDEISSVTVWISPDSGSNWISLMNGSIAKEDDLWGDFRWEIPAELTTRGVTYRLEGRNDILVRVQDYNNITDPHKTAIVPKAIAIQP